MMMMMMMIKEIFPIPTTNFRALGRFRLQEIEIGRTNCKEYLDRKKKSLDIAEKIPILQFEFLLDQDKKKSESENSLGLSRERTKTSHSHRV